MAKVLDFARKIPDPDRKVRGWNALSESEQSCRFAAYCCIVGALTMLLVVGIGSIINDGGYSAFFFQSTGLVFFGLWIAGIALWHFKPTWAMIGAGILALMLFLHASF